MFESLRRPGQIRGLWCVTGHPLVLESAAALGPDFICIDAQHGTNLSDLSVNTFTALAHYDVPGLARVPRNDPVDIGAVLDLGASGVMVPMIDDADEAEAAVAATLLAPVGTRSFGMKTPRLDVLADDYRPVCAVQIETTSAIENVDAIAAVTGLDWLYIGPADLGLSLTGGVAADVLSVFDGSHPDADRVLAAWRAVTEAAARHEKRAGLHCDSGAAARLALDNGFTVASVATDVIEMRRGMARQLDDT